MYTPTLEHVYTLSEKYNMIPICRSFFADTETPIRLYKRCLSSRYSFLLESVEGGEKWARYSFIGQRPFIRMFGKDGQFTIDNGKELRVVEGNPITILQTYLNQYYSPAVDGLPPFTGGAVGFFGYDVLRYFEDLPAHTNNDLEMDDVNFMFCNEIIVYDHLTQQLKIIKNVHIEPGLSQEQIRLRYEAVCEQIDLLKASLTNQIDGIFQTFDMSEEDELDYSFQSNVTKQQFIEGVNKAKDYILAGDIFQVVLSQRFETKTTVDPFDVYRLLRTINPSPYMYFIKMEDTFIVGASPESLVRLQQNQISTRPIAGTRRRGKTSEEDLWLEQQLLSDEKELAEHRMLVDLGRNDIGRISEYGSVRTEQYMGIERYSHVMHIVSHVTGELRKDCNFFDALVSCIPAGTVSGAPKLRAMEIIAEIEHESRGIYAGAIGYLGFSGNLDSCIAIRTILFRKGKAYVQAGAGIVSDSIPENEYEETVMKAKALLKTIRLAEKLTVYR